MEKYITTLKIGGQSNRKDPRKKNDRKGYYYNIIYILLYINGYYILNYTSLISKKSHRRRTTCSNAKVWAILNNPDEVLLS